MFEGGALQERLNNKFNSPLVTTHTDSLLFVVVVVVVIVVFVFNMAASSTQRSVRPERKI